MLTTKGSVKIVNKPKYSYVWIVVLIVVVVVLGFLFAGNIEMLLLNRPIGHMSLAEMTESLKITKMTETPIEANNGTKSMLVDALFSWPIGKWVGYLCSRKKHMYSTRATFVQVGANDGFRNDPLYQFLAEDFDCWVGLQVEPATFNFGTLMERHKERKDWAFVNSLVTDKCKTPNMTFWEFPQTYSVEEWKNNTKVRPKGIPRWIAIGQGNGLSQGDPRWGLESVQRNCIDSLSDLIDQHASDTMKKLTTQPIKDNEKCKSIFWSTIDLLQIDCEGHDWRVILATNFMKLRPHLIHFEGFGPYENAFKHLIKSNYVCQTRGVDVLCMDLHFFWGLQQEPPGCPY